MFIDLKAEEITHFLKKTTPSIFYFKCDLFLPLLVPILRSIKRRIRHGLREYLVKVMDLGFFSSLIFRMIIFYLCEEKQLIFSLLKIICKAGCIGNNNAIRYNLTLPLTSVLLMSCKCIDLKLGTKCTFESTAKMLQYWCPCLTWCYNQSANFIKKQNKTMCEISNFCDLWITN